MLVSWISAGVSSFIASYLYRDKIDKLIYIDIADQHPDSIRFVKDIQKFFKPEIEILKPRYKSVEDTILSANCIKLPSGFAPCTAWMKKRTRKEWELQHENKELTYIWGLDTNEKHRVERIKQAMPNFKHIFPLIDRGLSKQEAHGMCDRLKVKRPVMYEIGYNNNNCIGCIKGGMGYWNKIRQDFPDVFESRAKLERKIGNSILKECYLDELEPSRGRMSNAITTECDIFCMIGEY